MSRTLIDGKDNIKDKSIKRNDINITTPGQSLITKIIAGNNITISSTGADEGTGDVIINANNSTSSNINFVNVILNNNTGYIPRYSNYTIPFNKIINQNTLNFDINDAKFVVPKTGNYYISCQLNFSRYAYYTYAGIKINNSIKWQLYLNGYESRTQFSGIFNLSENQNIYFMLRVQEYLKLFKDYTSILIVRIK